MTHYLNDHLNEVDAMFLADGQRPETLIDRMMAEVQHRIDYPVTPNEITRAFVRGCDFIAKQVSNGNYSSYQPEHANALDWLNMWCDDQERIWRATGRQRKAADEAVDQFIK